MDVTNELRMYLNKEKDEWRYGGRPGWITDRGYVQRGITSSGLVGTPEKILS